MTFMPPSEDVAGLPPDPNLSPENDHPGFSDAEWTEMQQRLDAHYEQLYGSDPGAGSPPGQTGTQAPGESVGGIGTQPPAPSVPVSPAEYALGQVMVPAEDANSLGALYALIRNDPEKGQQILNIVQGVVTPPPSPPPIWQQQPPSPQYTPPPMQQYQQPPNTVQIVPPEVIESADPLTRLMYDRFARLESQQQQLLDIQTRQAQATAAQQRQTLQEQQVLRNTQLGIARFRQAHPEVTDDQLASINSHVQALGITGALTFQLPGDQAVAKAFEIARLDLGPSLTGAPVSATLPVDARRQATLTSLAGGSSGSVSRQEPPAPVDTAPDPTLSRAKAAAVEMLKQQGVNLADHM